MSLSPHLPVARCVFRYLRHFGGGLFSGEHIPGELFHGRSRSPRCENEMSGV